MTQFEKNMLCVYGNHEENFDIDESEKCIVKVLQIGDEVTDFKFLQHWENKEEESEIDIYFDCITRSYLLLSDELMFDTKDGKTFTVVPKQRRWNFVLFFEYDNRKEENGKSAALFVDSAFEFNPSYEAIMANKQEFLSDPRIQNLKKEVNDENFEDHINYVVLRSDQIEASYNFLFNNNSEKTEVHKSHVLEN